MSERFFNTSVQPCICISITAIDIVITATSITITATSITITATTVVITAVTTVITLGCVFLGIPPPGIARGRTWSQESKIWSTELTPVNIVWYLFYRGVGRIWCTELTPVTV